MATMDSFHRFLGISLAWGQEHFEDGINRPSTKIIDVSPWLGFLEVLSLNVSVDYGGQSNNSATG